MPKKKGIFNKTNSVKYRLLPGSANACNADGEVLPTILVPVSHRYKPEHSLLLSHIRSAAVNGKQKKRTHGELVFRPAMPDCTSETGNTMDSFPSVHKEPKLEEIMDQFEDAVTDDDDDDLNYSDGDIEDKDTSNNIGPMTCFSHVNDTNKCMSSSMCQFSETLQYPAYDDNSDQFSDVNEFNNFHSEYSLTSAKRDCPENIKIFNEQFEKLLEIYDEDQIGALDDEDIGGHLTADSDLLKNFIPPPKIEETLELGNYDSYTKEQTLRYAEHDEEKIVKIVAKAPVEYDCESILSTYSNIYNHPTIIKEETKIRKINITNNFLKKKLVKSQLKQLDKECYNENAEDSEDDVSDITSCNLRIKDETPEQKRERKNLFKEVKRENRILKKENKLAFKQEKKIQSAQLINAQYNRGIKLM